MQSDAVPPVLVCASLSCCVLDEVGERPEDNEFVGVMSIASRAVEQESDASFVLHHGCTSSMPPTRSCFPRSDIHGLQEQSMAFHCAVVRSEVECTVFWEHSDSSWRFVAWKPLDSRNRRTRRTWSPRVSRGRSTSGFHIAQYWGRREGGNEPLPWSLGRANHATLPSATTAQPTVGRLRVRN